MNLFKSINVVDYGVSDWERAKKFYGETLGFGQPAFVDDNAGWCEFGSQNEAHLAIHRVDGAMPEANGSGAVLVFTVEDAYKTTEELRNRGVKCDDVVAVPDMVTYGQLYDPDGNRIQFAGPPPQ